MSSFTRSEFRPDRTTEDPGFGESRLSRGAIPIGLFLASLAVRLIPWPTIFQFDGVVPFGGDAFYHLRRIRHAIESFPAFLDFDPLINFPHGAQPIWPPTFDWLVAMLLRIAIGPGEPETLERAVMWLAPVLGALTVVSVYFLGRHFYSASTGALAAALLAILPAHFQYSQLGFSDHHVAVSLASVGILWAGMQLFATAATSGTDSKRAVGRDPRGLAISTGLGLAIGAAVLIWPGVLLDAAIAQTALLVRVFTSTERETAICWGRRFALVQAVTFAVVLPLSAGHEWARWGSFSPVVLSNFQPLYFGAAAIVGGGSTMAWQRWDRCVNPSTRFAVATSIGLVVAFLLFGSIPALRNAPSEAWAWLSRDEIFQAAVGESTPLFVDSLGFDWRRPIELFGFFLFLVPLAWIASAKWDGSRQEQKFFLWWTAAFFVATLMQRRFMNTYSIAHTLLIAQSIPLIYRRLPRSAMRFGGSTRVRYIVVGGLILGLTAPELLSYRNDVSNLIRMSRGLPVRLGGIALEVRPVLDIARWLRENSPSPRENGYSVLGPWDSGHLIKYEANRAVVQDNFGDDVAPENFDLAERYYSASSENEALALLEKTRTRYVIVRRTGSGHSFGYGLRSMLSRLFLARGSRERLQDAKTGEEIEVDALTRHRLVYESPLPIEWSQEAKQHFYTALYEIVPGALVVGQSAPGRTVAFRLYLRSRNGTPFVYRSIAVADSEGRYALRLPYSNESMHSDVKASPFYQASAGDGLATFSVSEEAVRRGLEVEGPRFTESIQNHERHAEPTKTSR